MKTKIQQQEENSREENENVENNGNRVENAKLIKNFFKIFTLASLNIAFIACFIMVCVSYLIVSNQLVSRGFAINEKKEQFQDLKKQNRELELAVIDLESYSYINKKVAELGMVKISEIDYIEEISVSVAVR